MRAGIVIKGRFLTQRTQIEVVGESADHVARIEPDRLGLWGGPFVLASPPGYAGYATG